MQFKEADAIKFAFKILIIQFLLWLEILEYSSQSKQKSSLGIAQDCARWRSMTRQLVTNVFIYNLSFKPMYGEKCENQLEQRKWNIEFIYIFLSKHISGLHTALQLLFWARLASMHTMSHPQPTSYLLLGEQEHKSVRSMSRATSQKVGSLWTWTGALRLQGHTFDHTAILPAQWMDGIMNFPEYSNVNDQEDVKDWPMLSLTWGIIFSRAASDWRW